MVHSAPACEAPSGSILTVRDPDSYVSADSNLQTVLPEKLALSNSTAIPFAKTKSESTKCQKGGRLCQKGGRL